MLAKTYADVEPKSVLVAYDFSEASQKPLRHALAIARHFTAKLYVAHVVSSIGYQIAGADTMHMSAEATQREMEQLEGQLVKCGALDGIAHEFVVREGEVWPQLEDMIEQKHVGVVVVGTHGRGTLGKLLLGSVAESIFRQARCPVVTVGPGSQVETLMEKKDGMRSFLMATDFGSASLGALPYAVLFAEHFAARLKVLNVLPAAPIPEGFHWSKTGDLMDMREASKKESEKNFEELIRKHLPEQAKAEFMVKFGIDSEQILLASRELQADLIVLGLKERAHPQAAAHAPWEIAYQLVCGANCPVLTIRS